MNLCSCLGHTGPPGSSSSIYRLILCLSGPNTQRHGWRELWMSTLFNEQIHAMAQWSPVSNDDFNQTTLKELEISQLKLDTEEWWGARSSLRDVIAHADSLNDPFTAVVVCSSIRWHLSWWRLFENLQRYLPGCNPAGQSTGFQVSGLCRSGPKRADTRRSGQSEPHKTGHEARCTHKHTYKEGSGLMKYVVWGRTVIDNQKSHTQKHWPKPADSP